MLLSAVFPDTAPIFVLFPTTSSSVAESTFPFFRTAIVPNFPSSASCIAFTPYFVDSTLSYAVGVPPLCIYPSVVFLASSPVSCSSCFATISPTPPSFVLSTPAPLSLVPATVISPSFGLAPSATTTTLKLFPLFFLL